MWGVMRWGVVVGLGNRKKLYVNYVMHKHITVL